MSSRRDVWFDMREPLIEELRYRHFIGCDEGAVLDGRLNGCPFLVCIALALGTFQLVPFAPTLPGARVDYVIDRVPTAVLDRQVAFHDLPPDALRLLATCGRLSDCRLVPASS